jgi:NifU-like protein
MALTQLIEPFTWHKYSKKLSSRLGVLRYAGAFEEEASKARGMHLAIGVAGEVNEGNAVRIHWLVDPEDGVIVDARFTAFGQTALLAAADISCELCMGKNYDQARRVTSELIDKQVRDRGDQVAFPKETQPHVLLVVEALADAAAQCEGLPLASTYVAIPLPAGTAAPEGEGYPGWLELTLQQKIAVIEQILDADVRPYIALDAGGVNVLNLIENRQLIISYSGSCTSCYASVGTTLSYIQQVMRAKVHPSITVIPDL